MKNHFKLFSLAVLLVFCLCGCGQMGEYVYQYTGIGWFLDGERVIDADSVCSPVPGYSYDQLAKDEQKLYTELLQAVNSCRSFVPVKADLTPARLKQIYYYFQADMPQFFWMDGYSYTTDGDGLVKNMYLKFDSDLQQAKEKWQVLQAKVTQCAQVLSGLESDYQKSLWINDYLCQNTVYDSDAQMRYTAYGCLVDGSAVCAGYAKAAQLLFYSQDMASIYVRGDSKGERHGWNIVQLGEDWYHLDVTWNDAVFKNAKEDRPHLYTYLHVSDEMIQKDHAVYQDENCDLPDCTKMDQNYFSVNGLVFADKGTLAADIAKEAVESFKQKDYTVDFMLGGKLTGDDLFDGGMSSVYRLIKQKMGYAPVSYTYSYSYNEEIGTVRLYFTPK